MPQNFTKEDLDSLRERLNSAFGDVLEEFLRERLAPAPVPEVEVSPIDREWEWPWTYSWPAGQKEPYESGGWYSIEGPTGFARVLVAHTTRPAWGRDRERIVVFAQMGEQTSRTFYPWTEFVETDDREFAATIPDPKRPRSLLTADQAIPASLERQDVRRSDEVFRSIRWGPSLRLVLSGEDVEGMIRHGYWVASLRGRIPASSGVR